MVSNDGKLYLKKVKGKVRDLERAIDFGEIKGAGIGHTRWATHGKPTVTNAHPHTDCTESIVLVHNGIIENYEELREELASKGHVFKSDTDTEVIVHLIEDFLKEGLEKFEAVVAAMRKVDGAYAVGVIFKDEPNAIYAARRGSPLIIGVGEAENFIASDIPAVLNYTRRVVVLNDFEIAKITPDEVVVKSIFGDFVNYKVLEIQWSAQMAEKGGYPHYMLKEIHEQPSAIMDTMRGRIKDGEVFLPELDELLGEELPSRIYIVACGTSYHAGLVGKYAIEKLAKIPVEVDIASEFRYRDVVWDDRGMALLISQSGETADTLAAMHMIQRAGLKTVAVVNVLGSTMSRDADVALYTRAGPEISVASTKAFTSQLTVLYLFALWLAAKSDPRGTEVLKNILSGLAFVPQLVDTVLTAEEKIAFMAEKFASFSHFMYLGRGINWPVAMEGALKLKEISYIHAEAYPAGEMKHGPIALVDDKMPVFAIATKSRVYEKMINNIEEVLSREGRLIALISQDDRRLMNKVQDVIVMPEVAEIFSPVVNVVALQLFAYYCAIERGLDPDRPRNLAKSVTVE